MNIYNSNLLKLCEQRGITITEFENIIYIPKVRIMDPTPNELVRIAEYFNLSLDTIVLKDLSLVTKAAKRDIKMVILDVDGTMTDGGMYFSENGDQLKKYNTKDGMAIKRKGKDGLLFGIISHGYKLKVIQSRAELLGIKHVYVGQDDKLDVLKNWCEQVNIQLENVAYIGDDINDIEVMNEVGLTACPSDAVNEVKKIANIILSKAGGKGCIREFLDEWLS